MLIDRQTGRVDSEHYTKAFFYWHTVNAYDDGDHVVVDLITAPTPQSVWDLDLPKLRDPQFRPQFFGHPHRYRLPLCGGVVRREQLSTARMEFPRITDRHATLPYRHTYAIAYRHDDSDWFDQIIKLNTTSGQTHDWHQDDCYPSEPVFVPTPDAAGEDDGLILDVVLDTRAGSSFMLALDARDLTEIARAELPHHLPFNFHQQFYSSR